MDSQGALALALGAVLLASAAAKLASPRRSAAALAVFGVKSAAARRAGLAALVVVELGLAGGVASRTAGAAYAVAALMAVSAFALGLVLHRGGGGRPCACFGARSTVTRVAVLRDLGLAVAYAGLPSAASLRVSTVDWLAGGLAVALAGVIGLGVATLALAREIGELRLRLGPQLALELADEGPPVGRPVPLIERFALDEEARLALAIFSSEGCPLCRALEPSLQWLAGDPFVAMMVFDEHAEAGVWWSLGVPGSPYALVLDRAGTVLAKGAFNTGGQLEGMLATAERRAAPSHAEG